MILGSKIINTVLKILLKKVIQQDTCDICKTYKK